MLNFIALHLWSYDGILKYDVSNMMKYPPYSELIEGEAHFWGAALILHGPSALLLD